MKSNINNNNKPNPSKKGNSKSKKAKAPPSSFGKSTKAPVSISTPYRAQKPIIRYSDKCCIVSHMERFGSINGSVAFTATAFAVQPGLIGSFPWLSNIANRYESYKFTKLEFKFRTKASTAFVGDVTLALDYDASDSAPTSTIQMENWDQAVNDAPWIDQTMPCSLANLSKEKQWYTRRAALGGNLDIKTYDVGNFYCATEGQANTNLVGYLYVNYVIELYTPQLNFDDVLVGGRIFGNDTKTAANPLGVAPLVDGQAIGLSANNASVVTLAYPGTYVVAVDNVGTVITAISLVGSAGVTVTNITTVIDGGALNLCAIYTVVSTVAGGTLTYSLTATTITTAILYIPSAPVNSLA